MASGHKNRGGPAAMRSTTSAMQGPGRTVLHGTPGRTVLQGTPGRTVLRGTPRAYGIAGDPPDVRCHGRWSATETYITQTTVANPPPSPQVAGRCWGPYPCDRQDQHTAQTFEICGTLIFAYEPGK